MDQSGPFVALIDYLDQLPLPFWLSLLLGAITVALFAVDKFNEPARSDRTTHESTGRFCPRELTGSREFLVSFVVYWTGLEIAYVLISLIGPEPMEELGLLKQLEFDSAASFPLWVALILVGVFPRVEFLSRLEEGWRVIMHERASIPLAAENLAIRIQTSRLDFDIARGYLRLARNELSACVEPTDLDAEPGTTSHKWVRLVTFVSELTTMVSRGDPKLAGLFEHNFTDRHRDKILALERDCMVLGETIRLARDRTRPEQAASAGSSGAGAAGGSGRAAAATAAVASPPAAGIDQVYMPVPQRYSRRIDDLLYQARLFLACALLLRADKPSAVDEGLRALGLIDGSTARQWNDPDRVVIAFMGGVLAYFTICFLAPVLAIPFPSWLDQGWPSIDSSNFFLWTLSVIMLYGSALLGTMLYRSHRVRRGRWFNDHGADFKSMPSTRSYLLLVAVGYLWSLGAVCIYDGFLLSLPIDLQRAWPLALAPTLAATFSCWILDRGMLARQQQHRSLCAPKRCWLVCGAFTAAITFFNFAANTHVYKAFGTLSEQWFALLFATIGTLGFSLTFAAILAKTVLGRGDGNAQEEFDTALG